ncbi:MAG: transcription termination/antitermination protein NusA, partial [Ruminococcus sp.]|nr:transcription termination/antitermination protein NusA [Ruminococcus sp.]
NELNGEKIDIIPWSESPEEFVAKALSPAETLKTIVTSYEEKTCTVIVPNNQLSLAIGIKGQNAKLAAKLTGYKIDIKPHTNPLTGETAPELDMESVSRADEAEKKENPDNTSDSVPEDKPAETTAEEIVAETPESEAVVEEITESSAEE